MMPFSPKLRTAFVAAIASGLLLPSLVWGQAYPSRTIRVISGYAAGGNNDTGARIFAKELEARIKQPVIVENRPGAGGIIGARSVAQAPADGYTILFGDGSITSSVLFQNGLDPFVEFVPAGLMLTGPYVLYISGKHSAKNLQELVAYSKSRPDQKLNFASLNNLAALALVVLSNRTGINYLNIPFKAQAPIVVGLNSGELDISFDSAVLYKPAVDSGRVRALFATRKSFLFPDVPTAAQAGLRDFEIGFHGGMWLPAATPKDIVAKLSSELAGVMKSPEVRDRVRSTLGSEPADGTADSLKSEAEASIRFWKEAAKLANYKPE